MNAKTNERNGGYCERCGLWHELPGQAAWQICLELMAALEHSGRLDFFPSPAPPCLTTPFFVPGGGKMLGVLLCHDARGHERRLFAFSGMACGRWLINGWAPPVFDLQAFWRLHLPAEREIKRLSAQLALLDREENTDARLQLLSTRRALSQKNAAAIHALYTLANFRGESRPLGSFFSKTSGPPAGTGDCCAPKLVHMAQRLGLKPFSMAEFYWGGANASGAKEHGKRYLPCREKCQPILGFQLCGLQLSAT